MVYCQLSFRKYAMMYFSLLWGSSPKQSNHVLLLIRQPAVVPSAATFVHSWSRHHKSIHVIWAAGVAAAAAAVGFVLCCHCSSTTQKVLFPRFLRPGALVFFFLLALYSALLIKRDRGRDAERAAGGQNERADSFCFDTACCVFCFDSGAKVVFDWSAFGGDVDDVASAPATSISPLEWNRGPEPLIVSPLLQVDRRVSLTDGVKVMTITLLNPLGARRRK